MDHRSVQRYRVSIPTSFFWGTGSSFVEGRGVSRDLSVRGAFILTTDVVPVGSEIWLRLLIPGIREGSKGSEMQGTGHVVRSQADGFAVEAAIGFSNQSSNRKNEVTNQAGFGVRSESRSVESPATLEDAFNGRK